MKLSILYISYAPWEVRTEAGNVGCRTSNTPNTSPQMPARTGEPTRIGDLTEWTIGSDTMLDFILNPIGIKWNCPTDI